MEDAEGRLHSITPEAQDLAKCNKYYCASLKVAHGSWPSLLVLVSHKHPNAAMQQSDTFLFLPCDGNAKVLNSTRKSINQHVQYSHRQTRAAPTPKSVALPYQIRFRTRARHPVSKRVRGRQTSDQPWRQHQIPLTLT